MGIRIQERGPFNPAAHEFFVASGYYYCRIAEAYDEGTPESGPGYGGTPACDIYISDREDVCVNECGAADYRPADPLFAEL